jgi:hypothetical protein
MAQRSTRSRSWALAIGLCAAALLGAYVAAASRLDWSHQGSSDFGSAYIGAQIWRAGHADRLYDEALQTQFHDAAVAPDHTPSVPFIDAPFAAVIAAPFTFVDIRAGWRIFGLLQAFLVVAAALIAARSARWPSNVPRRVRVACALAGAAGAGTYVLVLQGQWSGLFAVAIALGHACWRRGWYATGAMVALTPLLAIKPNLALGLGAFLLGWGNRRAILGGAASIAAVALASLAVAGVAGSEGFVASAVQSTHQWPWSGMNSVTGIASSWFGDHAATAVIGLVAAGIAALGGVVFGRRLARDASRLDPSVAGAVVVTLLASPHLFHHDLAMLAPVLVWGCAAAARLDRVHSWPGRRSQVVLGVWALFIAVALQQLTAPLVGFPGRLVPWMMIAMAALASAYPAQAPVTKRCNRNAENASDTATATSLPRRPSTTARAT